VANFIIRFFICNIFISLLVILLLTAKHLLRHSLTNRMQYHLWFLFLGLLAVPFIPVLPVQFPHILSWLRILAPSSAAHTGTSAEETAVLHPSNTAG